MKIITKYEELKANSAYDLVKEEYLKDIKSVGMVLRHKKSGARVCLLPNEDENKVFAAVFRTTPTDSTGVPHIIEHTVLNGSKHFPSRDPFMQLAKGSLNTFLNAITFPDMTAYPVASCNDKDFKNLMHVYLDAVFFPNIYAKREIFMQEGWHYELESPEDELKINGVVYSEMKGAMSSPDRMIFDEMYSALMPDTTYGVNSGGDPDVIPSLTYENYLNFHRRFYHPSNAYLFLYGNMDLDERLDFMDREYLSQFDAIKPDSEIAKQKHDESGAARRVTKPYSIGTEEDEAGKCFFAYASLAGSPLDSVETRANNVLSSVLIESDSAPLKNALLDAGIGEEVYGGFDDAVERVFGIVAKNVKKEDLDRFYEVYKNTLQKEIKNGINEKAILGVLNRMEFEFREAEGGGFPRGLSHVISIMHSWLYDEDAVFTNMHFLDDVAKMKSLIGTGYFEKLAEKYMLDSDQTVLLTLEPQKGLIEKKEEALKEKLAAYKKSLSDEEISRIVQETKALREYQTAPQTEEEKNCIPTLARTDIPRKAMPIYNEERVVGGIPTVFHDIDTSGITYLTMTFAIGKMPIRYLPYIGLLADVLCSMDTERHSYSDLDIDIKLHTGDLEIVPWTYHRLGGGYTPVFHVKVKVMPENIPHVLDILAEVLTETKFDDTKRLTNLLGEIKSGKQRDIMTAGNTFAVSRAYSYYDEEACFNQQIDGLDYYRFVKSALENGKKQCGELAENLKKVAAFLFDPKKLTLSLGCDQKGYEALDTLLPKFTAALDSVSHASLGEGEKLIPVHRNEGIMIPSQVQYVARVGNFVNRGLRYNAICNVVKTAVNIDYLYKEVRVQGGAYGCGCRFEGFNGDVQFSSYRDPNLVRTDEVYKKTGQFVREMNFDEAELTKYIIGTFSAFERPFSPWMKIIRSYNSYMTGDTEENINARRAAMLDIKREDFALVADMFDEACKDDCFCVVGNEKTIRDNKDLFDEIVSI